VDIRDFISGAAEKLLDGHHEFSVREDLEAYPNKKAIVELLEKIRMAVFPGYFKEISQSLPQDIWLEQLLDEIRWGLTSEIRTAVNVQGDSDSSVLVACSVSAKLIENLVNIQNILHKDAKAGYEGDPAAQSVDEVILTYPGFFAVFVHRVANFLFREKVPFIPRMMSEYAHSITGVEIHPGAEIGEYFFIDHGTGVVIGETTIIGNNVKLYQGVTLGALSTKGGHKLSGTKRHPTIEDNVTIYSGATILGGETVIAENSVIGGNQFITQSVGSGSMV